MITIKILEKSPKAKPIPKINFGIGLTGIGFDLPPSIILLSDTAEE